MKIWDVKSGVRAISREIENTASSPKMKIVDMGIMWFSRGSKDLTDRFLSKNVFEIIKNDHILRTLDPFIKMMNCDMVTL